VSRDGGQPVGGDHDVTKEMEAATSGKSDRAFHEPSEPPKRRIESACGTAADVRCEVVTLYEGGVYDLYKYKRYQDVRVVFVSRRKRRILRRRSRQFHLPPLRLGRSLRAHIRQRQAAAPRIPS